MSPLQSYTILLVFSRIMMKQYMFRVERSKQSMKQEWQWYQMLLSYGSEVFRLMTCTLLTQLTGSRVPLCLCLSHLHHQPTCSLSWRRLLLFLKDYNQRAPDRKHLLYFLKSKPYVSRVLLIHIYESALLFCNWPLNYFR